MPIDRKFAEADYQRWKFTQRGAGNPEIQTNAFWHWAILSKEDAYSLHESFSEPRRRLKEVFHWLGRLGRGVNRDDSNHNKSRWCFDRLGQATVETPDGGRLLIAGEHEDHYDPDFFIYNDVVRIAADGQLTILGYSEDAFPPTDFHSATLIGDKVYLIGSLGYPHLRQRGETQVLALSTTDWSVSRVKTSGQNPGWIFGHSAVLCADSKSIRVAGGKVDNGYHTDNFDEFELCLKTASWTKTKVSNYQRWVLEREDDNLNSLWEIRNAKSNTELGFDTQSHLDELYSELSEDVRSEIAPGKFTAEQYRRVDQLYNSPFDDSCPVECEYNAFELNVKGIMVRFTEETYEVVVVVKGELPAADLTTLLETVQHRLSELEGAAYRVLNR